MVQLHPEGLAADSFWCLATIQQEQKRWFGQFQAAYKQWALARLGGLFWIYNTILTTKHSERKISQSISHLFRSGDIIHAHTDKQNI